MWTRQEQAAEKLNASSNSDFVLNDRVDLSVFANGSFDFIYFFDCTPAYTSSVRDGLYLRILPPPGSRRLGCISGPDRQTPPHTPEGRFNREGRVADATAPLA